MSPLVRINKLLSQLGIASRRKADELIRKGAVILNDRPITLPGIIIYTNRDKVSVYGRKVLLEPKIENLYFVLNKPKGYISTVKDTHYRKTIMKLLPEKKGIFPVGRLDKDTRGVILLTNDGELAYRLMHPRYEIEKIYEAVIKGRPSDKALLELEKGVDIKEKSPSILKILKIKYISNDTIIRIKLHEGRKRQIRRTFEALGYHLMSFKRISYGGISIDIKEGSFRRLTEEEVKGLKQKVELACL